MSNLLNIFQKQIFCQFCLQLYTSKEPTKQMINSHPKCEVLKVFTLYETFPCKKNILTFIFKSCFSNQNYLIPFTFLVFYYL
ncbi:conserved hypothetical protein [Aster yellows witches'-broom phytoplasma AYWB]|uniref:Uncharacterized protein n=2 Tax=16SrI (Aster yellows group) TaxID=3042590 RepID=Q2NJM8_AYWBP|nr:conserved hypothetical protein [Aster yellows witches'-broom phytoplasma AYWB]PEH36340.1 hypothetical protein BBA70_01170 [New Jersey aster yellows phytoplasma]